MVSVTNIPKLVYINEPLVNQQTQLLDQGDVEHIIEEYGASDQTTASGEFGIYDVLRFKVGKSRGSTESTAKKIRSTPIGDFAVYHGLLDSDNAIQDVSEIDQPFWNELEDGAYVSATGRVRRTWYGELNELSESYDLYDDILSKGDVRKQEQMVEQVKAAGRYFEMPMEHLDGCFVFKLDDAYWQGVEPDFPHEYREYTVMGQVKHVYRGADREHYMDVFDDAPRPNSHKERSDLKRGLRRMANSAEPMMGREMDESDNFIAEPDVLVDPVAVYW